MTRQHDREVLELAFETVESLMQIGEELVVLHVHLVGVHAHDGAFVHHVDLPCHGGLLVVWTAEFCSGAKISKQVGLLLSLR